MLFDIHSHILPNVDDGAYDIEESLKLISLMKEQGITDIIATPHFYPQEDNLESFIDKTESAFKELKAKLDDSSVNIFLGAEILYFKGIGKPASLKHLCLNSSNYLLLELYEGAINDSLFEDISSMIQNLGITPIIAHIERYYKFKNFRKLLKFVTENNIPTQVNASAFFTPYYKHIIKKLFKANLVSFIATDTHSYNLRPPMLDKAYEYIKEHFGEDTKNRLIDNSVKLYKEITLKSDVIDA